MPAIKCPSTRYYKPSLKKCVKKPAKKVAAKRPAAGAVVRRTPAQKAWVVELGKIKREYQKLQAAGSRKQWKTLLKERATQYRREH